LKPHLTEENKAARFAYAMEEVFPVAGHDGQFRYKDMFDQGDIDEKWFYLTRKKEFFLYSNCSLQRRRRRGRDVYRAVRNTNHLTMVMLEDHGGDIVRIPHMSKNTLRLQAALPVSLLVTGHALEHVDEHDLFKFFIGFIFKTFRHDFLCSSMCSPVRRASRFCVAFIWGLRCG
jgi:hypothetical protein